MAIHPVIMCGGPGSRLWPASTATFPKPFLDLLGGPTLFQRTVTRMMALDGAELPVIVTGEDHARAARQQLAALGLGGTVLTEPMGRDSAPALLAAAMWIARRDPEGVVVAVASDHFIQDDQAFADAVRVAAPAARAGEIVTFGVRPDGPATAYGYIRMGEPLASATGLRRVARFEEKPDLERARALVGDGCLWNSGNFMFRADVLLDEARRHVPAAVDAVGRAIDAGVARDGAFTLGGPFIESPKISIDVAVMEKTARAAVLPIDYAWSDLGAWDAIWAASSRDEDGNAISGTSIVRDSRGCLVRAAPGVTVLAIGLQDIAIVVQDGNVLVTALDRSADLKAALADLAAHGEGDGGL